MGYKEINSFDAAFKLNAINLAETEGNRAVACKFGINEFMIRGCRRKRGLSQSKRMVKAFRDKILMT